MKLPSKLVIVLSGVIVLLVNVVILGGIWFYTNYTLNAIPRDKEIVEVDPKNKEILENCKINIVGCSMVFTSKEDIVLE